MSNVPFTFSYAALTHEGKRRDHNEDRYGYDAPRGIFVLADGMGGHARGELAAQIVVEHVLHAVKQHDHALEDAILHADRVLRSTPDYIRQKAEGERPMGTTVVCARIYCEGTLDVAWVGDSRAYLLRGQQLVPLTRDHTWIQQEREYGRLTAEQAANHGKRHILLQALGHGPNIDVETLRTKAQPGDRIVLCSDGLTEHVTDFQMTSILRDAADPQEACAVLIERALEDGGRDNVTVVVVDLLAIP